MNLIVYKDVIGFENLKKGLSRTKNNVITGIDGEIKKDITDKRLHELNKDLASQKYKPKPAKQVCIPKLGGGIRRLGVASQIDKVVQGALLEKLEPLLEKLFLNVSFGFRPGKGCHDALKEIKQSWKAMTWLISFDIIKCFDNINHTFLLSRLKEYCDQSTIELIRKLLNAGYVDVHNLTNRGAYNCVGVPQGSLISPILCNFYLHALDVYVVNELIPKYNTGKTRHKNRDYSKRYSLSEEDKKILAIYPEIKKALLRVKHNRYVVIGKKFAAMDENDESYRRLHYIRYADDFLIGFIGPRKEAQVIYENIVTTLNSLKLNVNHEKSKIYHSGECGIIYLGMYLRYYSHNQVKKRKGGSVADGPEKQISHLQAQAINNIQFRVPIDKILQRLVDRGLAKARKDGTARGTAYLRWCMLEDSQIVIKFSSIIRGFLNYFSCINKRSDLWKIFSVVRKSCALTLAHKHGISSAARIYSKYGPYLIVRDTLRNVKTILFYPKSLKTKIDFNTRKNRIQYPAVLDIEIDQIPGSSKNNIKTKYNCEYENCTETLHLEAHHINPIANLSKRKDLSSFEKVLVRRKRKVVMLCKKHHLFLHRKRVFVNK